MSRKLLKTDGLLILKLVVTLIACTLVFVVFNPVFADEKTNEPTQSTQTEGDLKKAEIDQESLFPLLKAINEKAMLPMFIELKVASQNLYDKTEFFCDAKSESSFIELLNAWEGASSAWQQSDSLLFGPSVDDNIDFTVYFLPIKKGIIKELLQSESITKEAVDNAGVGAQGFGTLEYLLFSRESSLTDIQKEFEIDSKRCNYLLKATELLNDNIKTITGQWEHYGEQFALAGNNSLYFFESSEAMNVLVNKIYQTAQKVSVKKTALLSNEKEIKNSTRYKLPAWRSGSTLMQVKANVTGIKRILVNGKILEWMSQNNKAKVAEEITEVMDLILAQKVTDNDLFTALKETPESLQDFVINTQKFTNLIKTGIAPSLGVELGFNDNDGD